MEDTKKEEEVKKENTTSETKKVEKTKLGLGATVLLTIAATLGIIVLVVLLYFIVQAL